MRPLLRLLIGVFVLAVVAASVSIWLARPAMPDLPPPLRQALALLPTDVESVAGTLKPFSLGRFEKQGNWFTKPNATLAFDAILDLNLSSVDKMGAVHDALLGIRGRGVRWAIAAKRDQEVVRERNTNIIVLGMHPYESITILQFDAPLPADIVQALSRSATVTTLANGMQVFRPDHVAAAIVLAKPDRLILVTTINGGDAMLQSLVQRLEHPGGSPAFDDAARAWSLTDLDATLWAVRRTTDKPGRRQDSAGRDWAVFTYSDEARSKALFRSIKARWPWRGQVATARSDHELVTPGRVGWGGGYADTHCDCPDGTGLSCFAYSFAVQALGIMIWV